MWVLEKNLPNGKLYRDSDNPKKKRLELHLDPTFQVSASTDDCYVTEETASISLTDTDIRNGYYATLDETYELGLRFTGVHIPRGAKIISAHLTLVASASKSGWCNATIEGEASDNPSTFSTYSDFIYRPRTTAYTTWSMPDTIANAAYDSPDISNIIQEIVNRTGWQPGNALVIFISGGETDRRWYSYDGRAADAARLTVDFTVLVQDEGLGEDAAYVAAATAVLAQDEGLGEDAASITALIGVLDVGEGLDAAFTTASILAVDSGEGVDSVSAGTLIEGSDIGLGEDASEMFVMVTGEDSGLGEDSAEVRNLFMELLNKLFNFIVQILPLTIVTASISLITKVKKPRAKPPKEKPPPKKPPKPAKKSEIEKAIEKAAKIKR